MNRRQFLIAITGAVALGGGVGVLITSSERSSEGSERADTLGALRRALPNVEVSTSDLERYLTDYVAAFGPLPEEGGIPDDLVTRFLASTDFFRDTNASTVAYRTLYHPYRSPCWNPFFTPVKT